MADVVYIPAKVQNAGIDALMEKVNIPGTFAIVTTIQFLDEVNELKKKGYRILGQVLGCNITQAVKEQRILGQVLGCNITQAVKEQDFDAYLYIGTGKFHPLNLAFRQEKSVFILDPLTREFSQVTAEEKQRYEKRRKGMLLKYYAAEKIGIIVSVKSGQNQIRRAVRFKEKCGKNAYLFLCENVQKLEDFPDIDCWVNTACVRIIEDDLNVPMVNIRDVE